MTFKGIGAAIRRARESTDPKMTQKQLAAKIGKTESSIAKYEQGLVEIPLSVIVEIADVLGKKPVDLLGDICDPREYGDDSAQHDAVVHAHWEWDENGMDWNIGAWECSACKRKPETWWSAQKFYPSRCAGSHFCGNCGAIMDEEVP